MKFRFLPVLAVEQKLQRKLCVFIGGFNVPASVVVADDFAVPLEHELGNASAVDTPLRSLCRTASSSSEKMSPFTLMLPSFHMIVYLRLFCCECILPSCPRYIQSFRRIYYTIIRRKNCVYYSGLHSPVRMKCTYSFAVSFEKDNQFIEPHLIGNVLHHRHIKHIRAPGCSNGENLLSDSLSHGRTSGRYPRRKPRSDRSRYPKQP